MTIVDTDVLPLALNKSKAAEVAGLSRKKLYDLIGQNRLFVLPDGRILTRHLVDQTENGFPKLEDADNE